MTFILVCIVRNIYVEKRKAQEMKLCRENDGGPRLGCCVVEVSSTMMILLLLNHEHDD
jgi:hypothetical protein